MVDISWFDSKDQAERWLKLKGFSIANPPSPKNDHPWKKGDVHAAVYLDPLKKWTIEILAEG